MSRQTDEAEAQLLAILIAADSPLRPAELASRTGLGRQATVNTLRSMESKGTASSVVTEQGTGWEAGPVA